MKRKSPNLFYIVALMATVVSSHAEDMTVEVTPSASELPTLLKEVSDSDIQELTDQEMEDVVGTENQAELQGRYAKTAVPHEVVNYNWVGTINSNLK